MKVSITSEYRFSATPDGAIWTETAFPYSYWVRYLSSFDQVQVIARVKNVSTVPSEWKRVDGDQVSVLPLPDYQGPLAYLKAQTQIKKRMTSYFQKGTAIILAAPSPIALVAEKVIRSKDIPYGVEMMGDPWEVFSSTGIKHPLRIYFRYSLTRRTQQQVLGAKSVSYVTNTTLQKRYPASPNSFSVGVSNIDLLPEHLLSDPRKFSPTEEIHLVSVGSLEQLYKNPDVTLRAVSLALQKGIKIRLTWVGGGHFLPEMKALAQTLRIQDQVNFMGMVPSGDLVRKKLDEANLFILASKTEGLPRALIEAMARGLPCIGSNVGGIPELLEKDSLFAPNDPIAIFKKIEELVQHPERMQKMSERNLQKSRDYLKSNLDQKRKSFLDFLKNHSA